MENKKSITLIAGFKAMCSMLFIISAVLSVGVRAAPLLKEDAIYGVFAAASALSPPKEEVDQPKPSPDPAPAPAPDTAEPEPEETLPSGADGYKIVPVDLSLADGSGDLFYKNETDFKPNTKELLSAPYPIQAENDEDPLVLILHTHATESYAEEGADYVYDTRSTDPEKNMLAVGEVIANTLSASGVPAIHCETMHDEKSYNASYSLSCDSIKTYLKEYPSIQYVLDVHRDAIQMADGSMAKPVTNVHGSNLAQIMLVVGTDKGGADHPNWQTNLTIAAQLQSRLITYHESLARPINIRTASFNQQYAPGSLLVEVGTCANTLTEAKEAAKAFAKTFAALVKDA
ncbi:MAG: hypothetical protein HFE77_00875 [Clostridiales bacterium]|nr:hypothetical protein [Clostridiales bacterium]